MSPKTMIALGALLAGLGVAIGAFGAHGLENMLAKLGRAEDTFAKRAAWLETGVKYHLYHALAIVVLGGLGLSGARGNYAGGALALLVGIALFSGSLYAMTLGPDAWRKLGMVTPLGGLALLIGWALVAWQALRS
ncbi:MAG: DUF423 domain-containing protein [Planctomycetaceae bacterium]|nr:DUF423 domain-containing protein [Planctomycetaceae bacterium]